MSDFNINVSGPTGFTQANAPRKSADAQAKEQLSEQSFGDALKSFVDDVNTSHDQAEKTVEDLVSGRTDNLHAAVIAMNKAEMSFRYMMEVRNKLVQAYQEVQRLQM